MPKFFSQKESKTKNHREQNRMGPPLLLATSRGSVRLRWLRVRNSCRYNSPSLLFVPGDDPFQQTFLVLREPELHLALFCVLKTCFVRFVLPYNTCTCSFCCTLFFHFVSLRHEKTPYLLRTLKQQRTAVRLKGQRMLQEKHMEDDDAHAHVGETECKVDTGDV